MVVEFVPAIKGDVRNGVSLGALRATLGEPRAILAASNVRPNRHTSSAGISVPKKVSASRARSGR